MTENQLIMLERLLKWQIAEPARAVVNSESIFVRCKLEALGEIELAKEYWSWVCYGATPGTFPPEIDALQDELKKIDQSTKMPVWGTYGT